MFLKIPKNWHKFRDVCNFYPRNWLAHRILHFGEIATINAFSSLILYNVARQLMRPQFTLWLNRSCMWVLSILPSGEARLGSAASTAMASSRACSMIGPSVTRFATFRLKAMPLCCVPSRSPGPRSFSSYPLPPPQNRRWCWSSPQVGGEFLL